MVVVVLSKFTFEDFAKYNMLTCSCMRRIVSMAGRTRITYRQKHIGTDLKQLHSST